MIKILNKYFFLIACLLVSLGVVADPVPPPGLEVPPPPGVECCKDFEANPDDEEAYAEYLKCLAEPEKYCPIPIDNSVYVLMGAGLVLASFVIFRKIRHKKTPM